MKQGLHACHLPEWTLTVVAQIHAWRGEPDPSFSALDRAATIHDAGLIYFKYDPFLKSLRGDPRYGALLTRMNLPLD